MPLSAAIHCYGSLCFARYPPLSRCPPLSPSTTSRRYGSFCSGMISCGSLCFAVLLVSLSAAICHYVQLCPHPCGYPTIHHYTIHHRLPLFARYDSLCFAMICCDSLCFAVIRFASLPAAICQYVKLCATVRRYPPLSTTIHNHPYDLL